MRFGEKRLLPETPLLERAFFSLFGVLDPPHWLHFKYLERQLGEWDRRGWGTRFRILDAGCGRGDYSFYLARKYPHAEVVGVDFDPNRIERCRHEAQALGLSTVSFQVGDLVKFEDRRKFDLIVSIDVLEHIKEQEEAVRNLGNLLRLQGRFFFHIPCARPKPVVFAGRLNKFGEWAEVEHVAEDRTPDEFRALIENSGFLVETFENTFGRFTGELATSFFLLRYGNGVGDRLYQAVMSMPCKALALADFLGVDKTRYAVAIGGTRQ